MQLDKIWRQFCRRTIPEIANNKWRRDFRIVTRHGTRTTQHDPGNQYELDLRPSEIILGCVFLRIQVTVSDEPDRSDLIFRRQKYVPDPFIPAVLCRDLFFRISWRQFAGDPIEAPDVPVTDNDEERGGKP